MEFVMPHSIRIVIITEAVIHLWACTGTRVETSMGWSLVTPQCTRGSQGEFLLDNEAIP